MTDLEMLEMIGKRYAERQPKRESNAKLLEEEGFFEGNRTIAAEKTDNRISQMTTLESGAPTLEAFERIIGKNDMLPVAFLEAGALRARSVGRILLDGAAEGTGFLIGENLMVTNNHVIATRDEAQRSLIQFSHEQDHFFEQRQPVPFKLDPDRFFHTSHESELDYTIVAVKPESDVGNRLLSEFGVILMRGGGDGGDALLHEAVSIIQHPGGQLKQVAIDNNKVVDEFDRFLHYETDTEGGSSGSPVFNRDWTLVALHHKGIPEMEGNHVMRKDGTRHRIGQPDSEINWIANEGIRINMILNDLRGASLLTGTQEEIRTKVLDAKEDFGAVAIVPANESRSLAQVSSDNNTIKLKAEDGQTVHISIFPPSGTSNTQA